MKTTVSRYDFERAFVAAGRKDQFTYKGLRLLFEYFEEYEESTGEEVELDVVAICCDYSEEDAADIARNYSIDLAHLDAEDEDYEEQCKEAVREHLEYNTTIVGETSTGFVYACF
jgi:hypothetical protein